MARVVRIWTAAEGSADVVAIAVREHFAAFASHTSTQTQLANAFIGLHESLGDPPGDMLPLLESHFGLGLSESPSIGDISAGLGDDDFAEDVQIDPAEARIERVRQWRLSAVRGSSAAVFRKNVMAAYDSRCLFSGQKLPRTDATATPGVDAAHILPWSRFDIDSTMNGICLSKQCHWAFDAGIFRLSFSEPDGAFIISIPDPIRVAARKAAFDILPYEALTGPIPQTRLPDNSSLWPSKIYLAELNLFLDGGVA